MRNFQRLLLLTLFSTAVALFAFNKTSQSTVRHATRVEALNPSASTNWQITQSTSQLVGYRQQGGIVDIPEFEVLFDSGAGNSGEESYGVVIETPNEVDQLEIKDSTYTNNLATSTNTTNHVHTAAGGSIIQDSGNTYSP